jgi:3-hydroxybutyrate dehydrogenase
MQLAASTTSRCGRPLDGKVALVTGSTSGIGLGVAEALAAGGAHVVLNGLGDRSSVEGLVTGLAARHGVRVTFSPADVSRSDDIKTMVADVQREFDQVDILVNNAGVQHVAPIEEFAPEKWDAIIAINLTAAFHAIRAVVPGMKRRRWGRIVNIASAHALVASPFKSAYVAAKHGLLGLTRSVALETAEYGITANAVCPGYVLTPLVERQIPETARARGITEAEVVEKVLLASQPTRRFVTIEEVGAQVAFLCSPLAASITGSALPVDGGWTAH